MSLIQNLNLFEKLPSSWKILGFNDVLKNSSAGNIKIQKNNYLTQGKIPIVDQGKETIGGYTNDESFYYKGELPVIIFGDHTRIFKFIEFPFVIGADGVKVLVCKREDVWLKYVFYFLTTLNIPNTGYNRHYKYLEEAKIPLPPLAEQQRLAALLDTADALRRHDRSLLARYDQLVQSVFLELFGDPVKNEKGWEVVKFGKICEEIRYGTNEKSDNKNQRIEGEIPVIRIPNVLDNEVNFNDLKYAVLNKKEIDKLILKKGDLLFVRSNGNPEYIGRCAVFNSSVECVYASYLIRVRLNSNSSFTPNFIQNCLSFPSYREKLINIARTTAGNFNMNTEGLKSLDIISPPLSLQTHFAALVQNIEAQKERVRAQAAQSEALFQGLLQQAFQRTGTLDTN